ncbi:hypothetical protein HDU79_004581 [Rhizoclosmatium sp. JEL0117]|nr:hypothetical protein HDU79_004581 [Rhizoclosmatium sp. JEL0117]
MRIVTRWDSSSNLMSSSDSQSIACTEEVELDDQRSEFLHSIRFSPSRFNKSTIVSDGGSPSSPTHSSSVRHRSAVVRRVCVCAIGAVVALLSVLGLVVFLAFYFAARVPGREPSLGANATETGILQR